MDTNSLLKLRDCITLSKIPAALKCYDSVYCLCYTEIGNRPGNKCLKTVKS